jgi:two-component system nitrogen regulation response regulator GlnG
MRSSGIADVTTAAGSSGRVAARGAIAALTIVSHPTAHRTGERLLLEELAAGGEIKLSRNAPEFARPGRALGAPLGDPFV